VLQVNDDDDDDNHVDIMRLPTPLLFIPHVIYEHGKPWWNDTDRGNSLFHQSSLVVLPVDSFTCKTGGTGEGHKEFCLIEYLFHTSKGYLICRKILRHGANDLQLEDQELASGD
jgi:hypothetical protein